MIEARFFLKETRKLKGQKSMNIWKAISTLLNNPNFISFVISIEAGATWDMIKKMMLKASEDVSDEYLTYQLFADIFNRFYMEKEYAFDEKLVMSSFLEQVRSIENVSTREITRQLLSNTMGIEVNDEDFFIWEKCFIHVCTRDKYQLIYRKVMLEQQMKPEKTPDNSWMKKYMKGNCCTINFKVFEKAIPSLGNICTSLEKRVWNDIKVLIWEIIYNAQKHGKADQCRLKIDENAITIIDNGVRYSPLDLKSKEISGGGGIAMYKICDDYPEIEMEALYEKNENVFRIKFEDVVFDVNQLSEIIVPDLMLVTNMEYLYPDGEFKYYFIDIGRTVKNKRFLGASYSALHKLLEALEEKIRSEAQRKVFIYFSNLQDDRVEDIYMRLKECLHRWKNRLEERIVVISEDVSRR